jgi:O-antigen ligase
MLSRPERAALLALAGGTAAILPDALNRFVFPKLAVILLGALVALWCPPRGRLPRIVPALLATGALVLVAAALAGVAPLAQIVGRPPRYEGLIGLPVYAAALWAGAHLLGPRRSPEAAGWLLDCLAAAAIVIAAEAVLETAGAGALISNVSRPGSLLGNASDEGAWAVLALGPLATAALVGRSPLSAAGAVAAAATLVCSGSRGALIGSVVAVVLIALLERPLRAVVMAGLAVLAAAAIALPATRARVFESSPHSAESITGHELLASETLNLIGAHLLLGVGPSGFVDTIPIEHGRRWEREIGPANPPDSPENWLLQAASSGGIPLLLLAIALAALTARRGLAAIREQRDEFDGAAFAGMFGGLVGYAVALLFHFTSPGTTPLAALFAGAMLAAARGSRVVAARARWVRLATTLAGSALLVVLLAGAIAELPLRSAYEDLAHGRLTRADTAFRLAEHLRPWDAGVSADATHAYAVLAQAGVTRAARLGLPWAAKELAAWPDSVQALSDAAALDRAAGRVPAADRDLARALRLDPSNPRVRAQVSPGSAFRHRRAITGTGSGG